jgi:hypothetical protein
MNRAEIESLVQRWASAVASSSTDALAQLIAEDKPDVRGPALARAAAVQAAFTQMTVQVDALIVEGDAIAWRWTLTALRQGKPVTVRGVNFQQVANGHVVDHWTQVDLSAA